MPDFKNILQNINLLFDSYSHDKTNRLKTFHVFFNDEQTFLRVVTCSRFVLARTNDEPCCDAPNFDGF